MDFCFATLAALLLLFSAASCAPAGPSASDACSDLRSSSMELNHDAKLASIKARNGSKDIINFTTALAWIEPTDMCDPESLKQKPTPCIGKIHKVLTSYISLVEKVSGFQSCSEIVSKVKQTMLKLHSDMSKCVTSKPGIDLHPLKADSDEYSQPIVSWQEELLCQYTLDRLFSFSILTARVFAAGDPANHSEGSSRNACKASNVAFVADMQQ